MIKWHKPYYLLLFVLLCCRKPYNPPAVTGNERFLVVEGVINSGPDSTTIKLSRTVNISSNTAGNPVLHAIVVVISDQNVVFPLTETTNGNYVSAGLNLDNTRTYRLSIKTPDNKQYQSDFVPVSITPPIDSVGFNIVKDPIPGVQIYANAHDATNSVKYYRWDYSEAWEFHSRFYSYYISNGATLALRTAAQNVYTCYTNDFSSDIVIGSSAKLSKNEIYQGPIAFIPSTSEKIESEYSILLHQYALTAEGYNFWINLKKNTEQLGSIFDAQPTQLTGNIHCITNLSEPVIGYLSVSTVQSKRIFIPSSQLPSWLPTYPYDCSEPYCCIPPVCKPPGYCVDTVHLGSQNFLGELVDGSNEFADDGKPPVNGSTLPAYFFVVPRQCADCTIRGKVTPPPFWK
jgi:hypothetical protein